MPRQTHAPADSTRRGEPRNPFAAIARQDDHPADLPHFSHVIAAGPNAAADLDRLLEPHWLLTNGTGAYAMGTAAGVNTQRYHGLLIAATHPPVGRVMALSQMLERLTLQSRGSEQAIEFTGHLFRNPEGRRIVHPQGPTMLRRFARGLSIFWEYTWGELTFERELFLHHHQQAATLRYRIHGLDRCKSAARLALSPMLTLRDFHSLVTGEHPSFSVEPAVDTLIVQHDAAQSHQPDAPAVSLQCIGSTFAPDPCWWYRVHYPVDAERGQGGEEDLFVPGGFHVQLDPAPMQEVLLSVALGRDPVDPQPDTRARAAHLQPVLDHVGADADPRRALLAVAADDFTVDRTIRGQKLKTILAGYPWFSDWGRDTFIALPGLMLATGRFEEARDTLRVFAQSRRNGLVPNRFDDYDDNTAHYNTVDASLWFVHAAMAYLDATNDRESWNDWLAQAALDVIDAYIKGTDYDIRMAGDGLMHAGSPRTQLTWMDAACGDVVFTPRCGKAVEINALWHHVLAGMAARIADTHRDLADHFNRLTARIRRAFSKVFWSDAHNCLVDHVWTDEAGNEHIDASIRPNQIFVASLPDSPLPRTKQQQVLDAVTAHLLTPFGLRTLPEHDPNYHARYSGDQYHRDAAYHQGTIWPWLIGPYAEAVLRVGRFSQASRQVALEAVTPLLDFLAGPGLGQLHEIHEAQPPHRPVGCLAQAWSVAEVLRVLRLIDEGQDTPDAD